MMSNTEENPTTEVHVSRKRRTYSEAYKARIVDQVDACSVLGDKGELLRVPSARLRKPKKDLARGRLGSQSGTSPGHARAVCG